MKTRTFFLSLLLVGASALGGIALSSCVEESSSDGTVGSSSSAEGSSSSAGAGADSSSSSSLEEGGEGDLPDWDTEVERYYEDVDWTKVGSDLMKDLTDAIRPHDTLSYSSLWSAYRTTDVREDGTLWDMYSDIHWKPGQKQCGNYKKEGDCYNREHSVPKSWFGDKSPMNTDLHHIVPTDGWVNNKRGNNPLGEVGSATYTSGNGSKLGKSSYPGFSGTVFEPVDEYKGDFARIYFYFVTCYASTRSSWETGSTNLSNSGLGLNSWSREMFLEWAEMDPVSQKEIDRNDAVYEIQGNRNPYVDNPNAAELVFGD